MVAISPGLRAAIERQWADDEEYVATCQLIGLNVEQDWEVEARLRHPDTMPAFVVESLRRDWTQVTVKRIERGGEEVAVRRQQALTVEAVKEMTAALLRLGHTYNLEWLNWSEFDGHIYRSLHRTPLAWTFDPVE